MRIHEVISGGALAAALALTFQPATAQPAFPPLPGAAPTLPTSDAPSEAAQMTERYGLSSEQAAKVKTILGERQKKVDAVARQQLPPDQALSRLKALKDDETARISAVLTPEQRGKYEQDTRASVPAPPSPAQVR